MTMCKKILLAALDWVQGFVVAFCLGVTFGAGGFVGVALSQYYMIQFLS